MNFQSKNKVDPAFSMASMTDLIFLLLIFFMLTSSFVTPSGLPVNLPSSKASTIEVQKISVTVTKGLEYYVNDRKVSRAMLEAELKRLMTGGAGSVILHIDKAVASEHLVYVAGIATSLNAKVVLATKPGK
ncbi:MAG TPA: biopolymer transporter ExbD [Chryseosolibacter sp.]|nr:biopolymer transporter ExbD [Chryseosolibacter sp.]